MIKAYSFQGLFLALLSLLIAFKALTGKGFSFICLTARSANSQP